MRLPKLTRREAAQIKRLVESGEMTQRQAAKEYGVHEATISRAVRGLGQCYEFSV